MIGVRWADLENRRQKKEADEGRKEEERIWWKRVGG